VRRARDGALIAAPSPPLQPASSAPDARPDARPNRAGEIIEKPKEKSRRPHAPSAARAKVIPPAPSAPAVAIVRAFWGYAGAPTMTVGPGWTLSRIGMAVGLEFIRLFAVAMLGRCWSEFTFLGRVIMITLCLIAESLSGLAVFSELEAMHGGDHAVEAAQRAAERNGIVAQLKRHQQDLAALDAQIAEQDKLSSTVVDNTAKRGRTSNAKDTMDAKLKDRADMLEQRRKITDVLADMRTALGLADSKEAVAQAQVGPIKELAALSGGRLTKNQAARAWIAMQAILLGPFAAGLVYSTSSRRKRRKT
jgi:hypothetical protein